MAYELHYWPGIQGRVEFVRLALETAGAAYIDVARGNEGDGQGLPALLGLLGNAEIVRPPFACPVLVDGKNVIGQTAVILMYLGPRLGLASADESARLWTHQIQLTIADMVDETHNTHHPIASGQYYEEQKAEALKAAQAFREERLPKYLGWLEQILERNPSGPRYLVGARLSYADLSLFQLVEGLRYAFPKATKRALAKMPAVIALHDQVMAHGKVSEYLASARRLAFNEQGIFRHYAELDA
jgi:glutathione S-transferase